MGSYYTKLRVPKEMRNDPELNTLDIDGPFGPPHDRLRRTYYAIRDGKDIPYDKEKIMKDYEYICDRNSNALWTRTDGTPQELCVICNKVKTILYKP
jgi:hypothetical protein